MGHPYHNYVTKSSAISSWPPFLTIHSSCSISLLLLLFYRCTLKCDSTRGYHQGLFNTTYDCLYSTYRHFYVHVDVSFTHVDFTSWPLNMRINPSNVRNSPWLILTVKITIESWKYWFPTKDMGLGCIRRWRRHRWWRSRQRRRLRNRWPIQCHQLHG